MFTDKKKYTSNLTQMGKIDDSAHFVSGVHLLKNKNEACPRGCQIQLLEGHRSEECRFRPHLH